jgi:hypothetical protein
VELLLQQESPPGAERGISTDWYPSVLLVLALAVIIIWLRWFHLGKKR